RWGLNNRMPHNPLVLLIVGPIAAGVACLALPDRAKIFTKILALSVSLAAFIGTIMVFIKKPLIYETASHPILIADNLSAFIALAAALFAFLIIIYSFGFIKASFGRYFGYVLATLGSSLAVAYADNMIAFLTFWGFLAVLLYLLVNFQGTDRAAASAKKALIIIGGTDAVMIFGIGLIWSMTGTLSFSNVHLTLAGPLNYCAYFSLVIASFAKAGAMPFHSWLPDVAEDAPASVTAYLPASLDKLLGIYLLAKASLSLFTMNGISNFILALFGSLTIILAVIFALVQHDLKRLLGYHAVSQVGYMILGIGTGNPIGIAGGMFHMLNNTIYKSCLFLSAGSVEEKTHTTDLSKLGGLMKFMPVTFACFLVASLSISGIPPFNGFVSKWMVYQGIIESACAKNPFWIVWIVCAMFGSALTVASFMKLLHAVFMGRPSKDFSYIKEPGASILLPILTLALLCCVFGIFAFSAPISIFIIPAIGKAVSYCGIWNPALAAVLIAAGIILGALAYFLLRPGVFRAVSTFIGGEDADKLDRVTGVEFYNTIRDMKGLKWLYKKEEEKSLDIYTLGRKAIYFFTGRFQYLHNGILPTYLVWCLLGMIAIFFGIFLRA
ncbi:MAG: proton-conducting transporter membrane subunit, partial [Candidatus Omnitrophota bacterium]|nr:proton-conducting transporter membrane subunit [Candidatus Omnitrophota bacterium]